LEIYAESDELEIQKITEKKLHWDNNVELPPDILEEKVIFDITKS
jgi:hypothetical protein